MKKTKIISLCLAATLTLGMLAGCTKKEDQEDTKKDNGYSFDFASYLTDEGYFKNLDFTSGIELMDYKSIVIPKENHTPSQEEIQSTINTLLNSYTTYETLSSGTVKEDSTINIDFVGSVDGEEFEGGSTGGKGMDVTIGVTQFIDGFLDQLVGKNVGDNFDINVTFPEDYHVVELQAEPAVFNITINSMQGEAIVPEFNDAFVKENLSELGFESAEGYMETLTSQMSLKMVDNYIFDTIFATSKVDAVPSDVLDFQIGTMLSYYNNMASQYGLALDDFLGLSGFETREDFIAQNQEIFEELATQVIILQAIAKAENMEVTQEDIDHNFTTDEAEYLTELYGASYVNFTILQTKVLEFIAACSTKA